MREGATPSPGVARRRVETRARLLSVAARQFAERGFANVRLDEIADEADVARGTLYSHFESKDELMKSIVQPTLEHAVQCLQRIPAGEPRAALDELLRVYLDLWRFGPDAMRLAHRFREAPLEPLLPLHHVFVHRVVEILQRAADARLLRFDDPILAAHVLARTAVPLLESLAGRAESERLFVDAVGGLLLRPG